MNSNHSSDGIPTTRLSPLLKGIVIAFGFFHGFMLLVSFVPYYVTPHKNFLPIFAPYQELTGSSQIWDMFQSIPNYSAMSARIKVQNADGQIHEKGPVLPGWETVQTPDRIRYFYTLNRMLYRDSSEKFRREWESKLAEKVAEEGGLSFQVEIEEEVTRHLFHIAKDGKLSKTVNSQFGPGIQAR